VIPLGTVAATVAVCCAALALRPSSSIERRMSFLGAPRSRRLVVVARDRAVVARIVGCAAGAMAGAGASWALGIMPLPVIAGAYLGCVAPAVIAERRAVARTRDAEQAMVTLVEWLCALVAAGRPVESALARAVSQEMASELLNAALTQARRDYTLGVPLHAAISRAATTHGIPSLRELARRLERARELGRGAGPLLQDLRDDLRSAQRARLLRSASSVEGQLTLVVTLCYLPALALLVIVPLFVTLLAGLFS